MACPDRLLEIMDIQSYMYSIGKAARAAARELARAETRAKDLALETMAAAIERNSAQLRAANAQDVEAARAKGLEAGLTTLETPARTSRSSVNSRRGLRRARRAACASNFSPRRPSYLEKTDS